MRPKLLLLAGLAFLTALFAFRFKQTRSYKPTSTFAESRKNTIGCSPDWEFVNGMIEETDIPPMPGAGNYKWKISTKSDSAQFYFNQGINMYYSFHIIEAMASFKKAAGFDPNCAMLQWAQALAYGPNINDLGYAASPDALSTSRKAVQLSSTSSEKEKLLIDAQQIRYSDDSTEARSKLNHLYADKMQAAYKRFPNDADVATLYADALMLQHPWDLWTIEGTPKEWTPRIREVLEKVIAKTPNHPGANHYYIHVMEPSPYAAKALPSADRLGKLTPGLSHTVHMPSHIYLRTGQYNKGTLVNENAVNSYKKFIQLYAPVAAADFLYIIHNLHMQTNNAMLAGKSAYSVKSAAATVASVPKEYLATPAPLTNLVQYIYMTPVLVDVRFGRWDELLSMKQPESTLVYANILYHFGRGMALTSKDQVQQANLELASMRELMKDQNLAIPFSPFSSALEGAIVAENILAGSIALKEKVFDKSIEAFKKAVNTEMNMVYNEPRDWMLNPGPFLGNAYLKAGRYKDADKTFRLDLKNNQENGWALYGLYQSLLGQKMNGEGDKVMKRYKKAFAGADIKSSAAVCE
jgi:tetratricopeptide (TPR) repeat protein